jgi:hypothetical protein
MVFRQQAGNKLNDYYFFHLDIGKAQIMKETNGYPSVLATRSLGRLDIHGTFSMTVTASGSSITASWSGPLANGKTTQGTLTVIDSSYSSGWIGLSTYNCDATFSSLSVS